MRYFFLFFLFASCSSLSRKECKEANWFIKGLADAQNGIRKPKTKEYRDACYSQNVKIRSFDYLKGFEEGLKTYCSDENAKMLGSSGKEPHKACEEISTTFESTYKKALRDYLKRKAKNDLLKRYGKKCITSIKCTDGKRCQYKQDVTSFSDVVRVKVCDLKK